MRKFSCNLCNDFEGDDSSMFYHFVRVHPRELNTSTNSVIMKDIDSKFYN